MSRSKDTWGEMVRRLTTFRNRHGHCNVQTNSTQDAQLGRWVAAQRHRRKNDELTEVQIAALEKVGFVWSPADMAWDAMYDQLAAYYKAHGDCNVPTKWSKNVGLADWVQRQRMWKKKNRLPADRVGKLEKFGFSWAIYKGGEKSAKSVPEKKRPDMSEDSQEPLVIPTVFERLYALRGMYIQYNGQGLPPKPLKDFADRNNGDLPPYIPLPQYAVIFVLGGEGWGRTMKLKWSSKGALPPEVVAYVKQNGTLPPYQ